MEYCKEAIKNLLANIIKDSVTICDCSGDTTTINGKKAAIIQITVTGDPDSNLKLEDVLSLDS